MRFHKEIPIRIEKQAAKLQADADAVCDMRSSTSPLIFQHIVETPQYHSWGLAGIVAGFHILDKFDGKWARQAARLLGRVPTPEGGKKDHEADQRLNHSLFGGIAIRETLNGHHAYARTIAAADGAMSGRDLIVGKARDAAMTEGLDIKSRSLGKWKQFVLAMTQIVAVSPLARPKESGEGIGLGRAAVMAGMVGGTAMSGVSGMDVLRNITAQRHESQTNPLIVSSAEIIALPIHVNTANFAPVPQQESVA